jgi:hypothetical protein
VWAAELPDPHVDHGADALFAPGRKRLSAWEGFRVEAYMDRAQGPEAAGLRN